MNCFGFIKLLCIRNSFNTRKIVASSCMFTNFNFMQGELEQEKMDMKKEYEELMKKYNNLEEQVVIGNERGAKMDSELPEHIVNKIKELSTLVKSHMADNKTMMDTIARLTNERQFLEERIRELEGQNHIKLPFDDPVARVS